MPFEILREDLTKLPVDAIVNPTDSRYSGSGGVDRAVHQAAGPGLRQACGMLEKLGQGELRVTPGYKLPCEYVFHTRGPVWAGGTSAGAFMTSTKSTLPSISLTKSAWAVKENAEVSQREPKVRDSKGRK